MEDVLSFWKFINTGINGTDDPLHVKLIYVNAIVSTVLAAIVAGVSGFVFDLHVIGIIFVGLIVISSVYLISYIFYVEKTRPT